MSGQVLMGFCDLFHETFAERKKPRDPASDFRRVSGKIGPTIVRFCTERVERGDLVFHMSDLLAHVRAAHPSIAPGSPDRILRSLRRRRRIAYTCTNRAASEYTLEAGEWLNE